MATAKKVAAPAAKTTPVKTAPAKKVAAPAPAPAPVEEAAEEVAFAVGSFATFLGYGDDVPADEQVLTAGQAYEITGITEPGEDAEQEPGGMIVLAFPNPQFNSKKKAHPETNPEFLETEALPEELEAYVEEDQGDGAADQAAVEEAAAPAPAPAAKKAAAKTAAAAPAKTAAAKKTAAAPAAKKTAAAKKAPKVVKEKEPEVDPLDVDLEGEDQEVLALVEGSENLIETAQAIEGEAASKEYQLGGLLYHIRKNKSYLELEGSAEYAAPGGFEKFLQEYFNIEYRKAMYLIQIYVYFTLSGIENPAEKVATIGWTKAKAIAKLLTVEGADQTALVELAATSSASELNEAIKDSTAVGGTGTAVKVQRVTLKFRYLADQAATIAAALAAAKEQLSLKDDGEALFHIVSDWASTQGGGVATAAQAPTQRPAAKTAPAKTAPAKRVAAKA